MQGCLACQKLGHCVIQDGASAVLDQVRESDVLVFAAPIYYYAICGQLKTFLDRMNPIFSTGHSFRSVYLLAAAADLDASAMDGAVKELEGWVSCFDGAELSGVVRGTGAEGVGESQHSNPGALQQAYQQGRALSS